MKEQSLYISIGEINYLKIIRESTPGIYLQSRDEEEVLLPNIYVDKAKMSIGTILEVFVYTDSEDRIVATTQRPKAMVGEFGYFEVVDVKHYGAFVNWELPKDLLVPLAHQKKHFEVGSKHILAVVLDSKTSRVYASEKIGKFLSQDTKKLKKNQEVDLLVIAKTPLGYKVIIDNSYEGMVYKNEIFKTLDIGDKLKGYIKKIRTDGKLDISLKKLGIGYTQEEEYTVLSKLAQNGGYLSFTYKSNAQEIQNMFGMSKKSFKKVLTKLIDTKQIELLDNGIELL
jgi:predicted RNA-binding protein (virulence factor B family)